MIHRYRKIELPISVIRMSDIGKRLTDIGKYDDFPILENDLPISVNRFSEIGNSNYRYRKMRNKCSFDTPYFFKVSCFNVSNQLARKLYYVFVYSNISYGIEVYGSCSDTSLDRLQVIQNKLLKLLL